MSLMLAGRAEAHGNEESFTRSPPLELKSTSGSFDLTLTIAPGRPVANEPVSLSLAIQNRITGKDYVEPVLLRVIHPGSRGEAAAIVSWAHLLPMDVEIPGLPHFAHATDGQADGRYVIEASLTDEGKTLTVPFEFLVGESMAPNWWVVGGASGYIVCLVGVRAIQVKRRRRAEPEAEAAV